ncbi:4Fe-4S cluster-binding domain-containing protein [Clostridium tyrobutyricum]|uniref:Anaerobic ribonucleoside-triphosphate reductase-activating protein n=1 Tax=Clostridium tyrobutyricum DIVETGP TaxID=1408889 RepID=W6NHU6_CLOTY|nr:4Fe-4S single cluster domain-containing protein [Clostridium tyrobutyricum]AND85366.1 anaerobic ribonucleoside-triphosphate reductase-activating protein [Clostridium tyrobutyricum]ANP69916.1 hypothetical protein BA182_09560 [Clostridium tyrobutyricum]MBV4435737.1 radical SAM protein [Clostridium tyrobutyricum]MBV4450642.1 radical SAM protein [Clostridium tyrobutyricum]QCH26936.1 Pyruvate formate-lyase 1-activating enzyme [Clostridium tyrobutyricum]
MNNNLLKVAGIIETSVNDGPGIRTVLFFQGCSINCKYCHNESIWNTEQSKNYTIKNLFLFINKKCINKKLTLSGGEPLDQYSNLIEFIKLIYKHNYDICLYTGYELDKVPQDILKYLTYLKTGPFIEKLKDSTLPFIGSKNQNFYKVIKGGGKICMREI